MNSTDAQLSESECAAPTRIADETHDEMWRDFHRAPLRPDWMALFGLLLIGVSAAAVVYVLWRLLA